MKIPYLSERKMKVLIKRMREKSIKLCTGLYHGSGAGAPATLSSVQGVSRHGRICCRCDAGRCAAGRRSGTTPAQTALILKALGRNEAFPAELDLVQETYMGCRLPQDTDFMSWDLDVKDSSADHVWPRLCAEVHARSGVLGVGVPPPNRFPDPRRQVWGCFGKRSSAAGCCRTFCLFLAPGSRRGGTSGWQSRGAGEGHFSRVAKTSSCEPCGGVA